MIEDALSRKIDISMGGNKTQVTAYYAIVFQLFAKAVANHKRAIRVLAHYRDYAAKKDGGFKKWILSFEPPSTRGKEKE